MVKVTVELVSAKTGKTKHLGTAKICNDGSGSIEIGNYSVLLSKIGRPDEPWRAGTVKNFDRKRKGGWDLLYLALKDAIGDRNDS